MTGAKSKFGGQYPLAHLKFAYVYRVYIYISFVKPQATYQI